MSETTTAGTLPDANLDQAPDQADASPAQRKPGPTAAEAKLLKEVMRYKADKQALAEKLKQFGDLDAAKVQQLVTNAEAARKAAQDAENDRLIAAGEFDRFKANLAAERAVAVQAMQDELAAVKASNERALSQITELTIGNAFADSPFVKELSLPLAKARKLYADHFAVDVDAGKVVPVDADKQPMVDGSGEPLSFDAALKRLVDADPDRDSILRSSRKVAQAQANALAPVNLTGGLDRLAHAVAGGALPRTTANIERQAETARLSREGSDKSKITNTADRAHDRIADSLRDGQLGRIFQPGR